MNRLRHHLIPFLLGLACVVVDSQYGGTSLINTPQQQQQQQQRQPTGGANTGYGTYSSGIVPKDASPSRTPYAGDARQQYTYGQFAQPQSAQQQQTGQQQNPSSAYGSNTDQYRIGNPGTGNSLSAKLEQQYRPQSNLQQQQQTQPQQQQRQISNRHGTDGYGSGGGGVNVQVQLKAYANPERQIAAGKLCTCPPGNLDCVNKSPTRSGYSCLFGFTVLVASDDTVVHKRSTSYLLLSANGQVAQEYLGIFQRAMDFQLESEPTSINVFVNNLGPVINADGTIEEQNTVADVDAFVVPLRENTGGGYGGSGGGSGGASSAYGGSGVSNGGYQQPQQVNLVGTQLGTKLSLTYTVACRGRLIGPGCDLSCNRSAVNSGSAICVNAKTGYFSQCRWTNGNSQVSECKNCPWGIEENAYCRDENGGVLEANHAGVVSEGYQTATVILGIICGLLAFCLAATCVYSCARVPRKGRKTNNSRTPPAYSSSAPPNPSSTTYLKHSGDAEAPLNNAIVGPPQPPRSGHLGQHFLPPLPNGKAKASMRSPILYPMPPVATHSLNDTMNSSFTGSQAPNAPPSVSADV